MHWFPLAIELELEEREELEITLMLDDELEMRLLLEELGNELLDELGNELLDELEAILLDTELEELDCPVPPAYSFAKPNIHA